jgi:hypothetical protein
MTLPRICSSYTPQLELMTLLWICYSSTMWSEKEIRELGRDQRKKKNQTRSADRMGNIPEGWECRYRRSTWLEETSLAKSWDITRRRRLHAFSLWQSEGEVVSMPSSRGGEWFGDANHPVGNPKRKVWWAQRQVSLSMKPRFNRTNRRKKPLPKVDASWLGDSSRQFIYGALSGA